MRTRRSLISWAVLLAAAIFCVGCVGTDVGNPPDDRRITATLEFETYVGDPAGETALITRDGSTIDEMWLSVEAIRLTVGSDCDAAETRTIDGPFYVDLVRRNVLPAPPVIAESPTTICGLKLDLGPAEQADAPAEIAGKTLNAHGEGADGPFSIGSVSQRMLPYGGTAFTIDDDGSFVDAFEPSGWLDSIQGQLDVNDASPSVINAFWLALRKGSRIVPDRDQNRHISVTEFDAPVALPEP